MMSFCAFQGTTYKEQKTITFKTENSHIRVSRNFLHQTIK